MRKEELRKLRASLRAKGICTACHKRQMEDGVLCKPCKKERKLRSDRLKAEGLCKACLTPLDDTSKRVCVNCQAIASELQFWRRQKERM